ncbi:TonB-dependent receptor [candidate division KSB1 bacterium]|nr:TonB-dependent receptor [candidate division KSB1 bacterium]
MIRRWLIIILLLSCATAQAVTKYTVSGHVVDGQSKETIIGVNVIVHDIYMGAATDGNGYFRITGLPAGTYVLDISHIAYEMKHVTIVIRDKGMVLEDIALQPKPVALNEIVVTGERSEVANQDVEPGLRQLSANAIRSIPASGKDVFRAVKYLPGIEGVDPISPLYSVRGSDPGENLILLDGVTIYNPYHFVTSSGIFNTYAMKNVEMLVGGYGAEYGGRNSSVMYITTREGNSEKLHGEIEPSLTYTNMVLDFPVGKDMTMMISSRVYYDLITRFLMYSPSYFYDTNIALNWKINRQNRLSVRYFYSRDLYDFQASNYFSYLGATFDTDIFDDYDFLIKNDWRNQAATAILKTVLTPNIYLKTQVSGSFFSSKNSLLLDFNYTDDASDDKAKLYYSTDIRNKIRDLSAKSTLNMTLNAANTLMIGAEAIDYDFSNDILINHLSEGKTSRRPHLLAGFAEDQLNFGWLTLRGGYRFSKFSFLNKWYREPRVNAVINLWNDVKLKAAWGNYYQYIMSINSQEYELSQFVEYYYPLRAQQPSASTHYIVGIERPVLGQSKLSVNFYYKNISRVYTYDYNISQLEAMQFSDKIKAGTGKSYGMELMWQGTWRTFSGWMSYGLSKSTRSYPHIMNGREFLFDYDRTHALKVMINHQILPTLSYSGTLRLMSGVPKTIETTTRSYFYYDPLTNEHAIYPVSYSKTKNNARLPYILELDFGLKKRLRKGFGAELAEFLGAKESYLNFSINNLLFFLHRNVWYYISIDEDKLYGLGTNYIPTISTGYTIKF